MADIVDQANDLAELELRHSLARYASSLKKDSALYCIECGEKIPSNRREALLGVQLCITCASHNEEKNKHFKR